MADEKKTPDGSESFVVHEHDGQEPAAAEGSIDTTPEPKSADVEAAEDGGEENVQSGDEHIGDEASAAGDEDGEDAGDEDGEEEAAGDEPKKKKVVSAKQRIGQLTKSFRDAEREAETQREANATLQARLDVLENKLTPDDGKSKDEAVVESKSTGDDGKPDPDKFPYGELDAEYQVANVNYLVDKRDAENEAKREKTRQTEAAEQHAQKVQKSYDDKIVAGAKVYKDFEDVVIKGAGDKNTAPKYALSPEFAMMALESPVGHHVVYEVASDPAYSRELAKMTPVQQAQEFGRLAAQHTSKDAKSPKKNKLTSATPPPISRVNGADAHKVDVKDLDFAAFEKRANKEVLGIG